MVESLFIQGMRNQQIQMDLLSEDRTPSETLNYALAREIGQANQQKNAQFTTFTITHQHRQPVVRGNTIHQETK